VLLTLASAGATAQKPDSAKLQILINLAQRDSGRIELIQPPQVENLLKMQIANNNLQEGIPGFRIHIFSDSGQQAEQRFRETRTNFMRMFPEYEAHQEYNPPNFQIKVGDFRTKNEALRAKKRIERNFPRAFIVNDIINISK